MYLTITTIISVKSSVPTTATHAIASTFNSLGSSVEVPVSVEVLETVEVLDSAEVLDFVEVLVVLDDVSKKSRYFQINV